MADTDPIKSTTYSGFIRNQENQEKLRFFLRKSGISGKTQENRLSFYKNQENIRKNSGNFNEY